MKPENKSMETCVQSHFLSQDSILPVMKVGAASSLQDVSSYPPDVEQDNNETGRTG